MPPHSNTDLSDWPITADHSSLTCSIEHDPRVMERPHPVVHYLDVHPNTPTGTKPAMFWHRLGPPARPEDELMHRHFVEAMRQLAANQRFVAARAFYPDAEGVLVAFVRWEPPARDFENPITGIGRQPGHSFWIGYNARSTYAAAMTAIQGLPGSVLQARRVGGTER